MSEHIHEHHHHDEHCDCGCHDHHEHEHHHHDEHCDCGCHDHHEHEHHHHDEHCDCGCHDHHEHEHHHHDEHCDCGCHDHEEEKLPGVAYTKVRLHDDAKVVSGSLTVFGDYEKVRAGLNRGLTDFAAAVTEKGGIIGHIKASAEVKNVEMFSVTDVDVMIKTAPEQEINIILAAIVFFVTEEEAEELGKKALESAIC